MQKKRKLKSWPFISLFFIVVFGILLYCASDILSIFRKKETKQIQVVDKIDQYHYSLNEHDSKYFKTLFRKLQKVLKEDSIDEEEYAKLVGQLFIADFYDLDSALNKNDIGGLQFVYQDYQETFKKLAKDSIYKYVENNIYGNRKQELPKVSSVTVTNSKQASYKSKSKITDEKAYYLDLEITYEKDLDYPTTAHVILIHNNDKLEIASQE